MQIDYEELLRKKIKIMLKGQQRDYMIYFLHLGVHFMSLEQFKPETSNWHKDGPRGVPIKENKK